MPKGMGALSLLGYAPEMTPSPISLPNPGLLNEFIEEIQKFATRSKAWTS